MNGFKAPDLNAPRFRPAVYNAMNEDFFNRFRKKHPKYKNLRDPELRRILKTFNTVLYETVVDYRDGVKLPHNIGWLFVGSCKGSKKKNVDYAKSNKYGVLVTNKNWDSDGRLAKIIFTSYAPKYKMKNREYWGFIACRDFKRLVAKTYPENWNMYRAIDPTKKIKELYSKQYYKDLLKKQTNEALKDYNEFDL